MDKDFLVALEALRRLNMRKVENDTSYESVPFDSKEEALEQIAWLQSLKRGDLVYSVPVGSVGIVLNDIYGTVPGVTLIFPGRRDDDNDYVIGVQSSNFLRKPTDVEVKELPEKDLEICRRIAALKKGDIVKLKGAAVRFALVDRWMNDGTIFVYCWKRADDSICTGRSSVNQVVLE